MIPSGALRVFRLLFVVVFGAQTYRSREKTDGRFELFAVMLAFTLVVRGPAC